MTIPFPYPENASEARGNMIYWADVAEKTAIAGAVVATGMSAIEKAKMWAAIALAMPEDMDVVYADDRPLANVMHEPTVQTPQIGAAPSDRLDVGSGTDAVDSRALGALRALAIRCIETHSLRTYTTVNVESQRNDGVLLVFEDVPPGRVKITVEDQN